MNLFAERIVLIEHELTEVVVHKMSSFFGPAHIAINMNYTGYNANNILNV
jgi:hypothetical protein